jgi:hypothetical protein
MDRMSLMTKLKELEESPHSFSSLPQEWNSLPSLANNTEEYHFDQQYVRKSSQDTVSFQSSKLTGKNDISIDI